MPHIVAAVGGDIGEPHELGDARQATASFRVLRRRAGKNAQINAGGPSCTMSKAASSACATPGGSASSNCDADGR